MKTPFILLATLFFLSANAQDSAAKQSRLKITYTPKKHKAKDSIIPAGRNELYFNIAPVFTSLLGAYPSNEANFSLFYKRTLKNPRWAMRTGINYKPQILNYYNIYNNTDWYFDVTDSTRTVNKFISNNTNKWQLNAGMELRSKGNKRWSTFAGLDIIGGIFRQSYVLYDIHEVLDSNGYWIPDYNSAMYSQMLDYKRSTGWYVGLSPKLGVRYAFNSHWMMSLQASMETYFRKSDYYVRNSFGTSIERYDAFYYELNVNSIFDEFSIVYRF